MPHNRMPGPVIWPPHVTHPRHGEAVALALVESKKQQDPEGTGQWWKPHPDMPTLKAGCYVLLYVYNISLAVFSIDVLASRLQAPISSLRFHYPCISKPTNM